MHKLPADLKKALASVQNLWKDLTPLGRNEYICWITSAKTPTTRNKRIKWAKTDLTKGKRRPCCWAGCKHR